MTTTLVVLVAAVAAVAIVAIAIVIALREAKLASAADERAAEALRSEAIARKQGTIIAEHRDDSDTERRMRDGSF